jgi:hypothetical protein
MKNTHNESDKTNAINHLRLGQGARRGNLLVGCLTVLAVVLVLVIIGTIFVMRSYRGWLAKGMTSMTDAVLVEMNIDETEHGEIMEHVESLMTKYEQKELDLEDLGEVLESIVESPLMGAAMVGGIEALYFDDSGLSDDEKAEGLVQLGRYAQGLREDSIDPETVETVLASVSTDLPDDNDIQLNFQVDASGTSNFALRSSDEVSDDDLRAVFAEAKSKADEAGIIAEPEEIDLSDALGVAIAEALGEDPSTWVEGYEGPAEVQIEPVEPPVVDEEP